MFAIAKLIANLFGWDIQIVQKVVMVCLIALIGVAMLAFGLWMNSYLTKTPKLDEKQIQKAQTAIAEQDAQKMREVLIESDVKEAVADNTVTEAKSNTVNAIAESKSRWANANVSEMQAELERRARE